MSLSLEQREDSSHHFCSLVNLRQTMLSAAAGSVMIKTEDFGVQEETADFFFLLKEKEALALAFML